jgi:two-component system cell cycle response regulator DivK
MDDLELTLCIDQKFASVIGTQYSIDSKPLILAVDDDEDNLLLLAYALEPRLLLVITAVDGRSALSLARSYQPDLILLDILMPYMNGVEVVSQLREDPKIKTIPVIAVTALAIAEDRERLLQVGFNDYISKPYMLEDIEASVRRYLRLPESYYFLTFGTESGLRTSGVTSKTAIMPVRPVSKVASLRMSRTLTPSTSSINAFN